MPPKKKAKRSTKPRRKPKPKRRKLASFAEAKAADERGEHVVHEADTNTYSAEARPKGRPSRLPLPGVIEAEHRELSELIGRARWQADEFGTPVTEQFYEVGRLLVASEGEEDRAKVTYLLSTKTLRFLCTERSMVSSILDGPKRRQTEGPRYADELLAQVYDVPVPAVRSAVAKIRRKHHEAELVTASVALLLQANTDLPISKLHLLLQDRLVAHKASRVAGHDYERWVYRISLPTSKNLGKLLAEAGLSLRRRGGGFVLSRDTLEGPRGRYFRRLLEASTPLLMR